jgi:hypothetical protein
LGRGRANGGESGARWWWSPRAVRAKPLGVRGAEGKGTSERSGGGSVKGTCEIKELTRWRGLLRRWLDDVALGREVTASDLEMLRRGERWRGEPNEWDRMGTRCAWTREPSGKDGRPWEISLERSREPGSMGLDGNVRNTDRAV